MSVAGMHLLQVLTCFCKLSSSDSFQVWKHVKYAILHFALCTTNPWAVASADTWLLANGLVEWLACW